jgi:hypothetical protein
LGDCVEIIAPIAHELGYDIWFAPFHDVS